MDVSNAESVEFLRDVVKDLWRVIPALDQLGEQHGSHDVWLAGQALIDASHHLYDAADKIERAELAAGATTKGG